MRSQRFQLRAGLVDAIQYLREENIHQVEYFFKQDRSTVKMFRYQETLNEYGVVIRKPNGESGLHILEKGEWIVRNLNGRYLVFGEEEFHKLYKGVDDLG